MAEKCCRACEKLCAAAVRAPISAGASHASAVFLCDDRRSYRNYFGGTKRDLGGSKQSGKRQREKGVEIC